MELNAEQIKMALECCKTPLASDCENCSYTGKRLEDGVYEGCVNCLVGDALSLIKELTEENERLMREKTALECVVATARNQAKNDTVRKMQCEIKERCIKGGIYPAFVESTIEQIAKEMESANG